MAVGDTSVVGRNLYDNLNNKLSIKKSREMNSRLGYCYDVQE